MVDGQQRCCDEQNNKAPENQKVNKSQGPRAAEPWLGKDLDHGIAKPWPKSVIGNCLTALAAKPLAYAQKESARKNGNRAERHPIENGLLPRRDIAKYLTGSIFHVYFSLALQPSKNISAAFANLFGSELELSIRM